MDFEKTQKATEKPFKVFSIASAFKYNPSGVLTQCWQVTILMIFVSGGKKELEAGSSKLEAKRAERPKLKVESECVF